jgi:queuine tRNA-ribosyltransferase
MVRSLHLPHGELLLPAFLPDATRGVVRSVDSTDLERCGVEALVMNTYHLMQHPGSSTIQALGGLHKMAGWTRPIATDSGGFQIYSLIRQNQAMGSLTNKGATFRPEGATRKFTLTPEKSIQLQVAYGADILFCLDDCTHVSDPLQEQRESVRRTIDWARRSKAEFARLMNEKRMSQERRPLLFAVIQGGGDHDLRRQCAGALLELGFDGFGFGGWPLDDQGQLLADLAGYTRELVPPEYAMHGLGIAHPVNVATCARLGYDLFDGALPTRDARHGRLYVTSTAGYPPAGDRDWFSYLYINDAKHIKSDAPVSPFCDCPTCTRYSVGYLHHLFDIRDTLSQRLATMHNLAFMSRVINGLRGIEGGTAAPSGTNRVEGRLR